MDFEEMDEMWHRIREEHAGATAGMTPEEKVSFYRERATALAQRLRLKVVTETTRRARREDND